MATVLVIGGGGREHALSWKLSQSGLVQQVLVAPGNGGTDGDGGGKMRNVDLKPSDHKAVVERCKASAVDLVVIGPEVPLVEGLGDALVKAGVPVFGPSKKAAQLEGSKAFSKDFMKRNSIPTAAYQNFSDFEAAKAYIQSLAPDHKVVVKASGLAAGKGVILPETQAEAVQALESIMKKNDFGAEAGAEVVVEDLLEGPEVSVFAFCDGKEVFMLPASQDHKRIFEGDKGPNTGGMGAYCPAPVLTPELARFVKDKVVQRTVDSAAEEGLPFVGLLYCGLMLTPSGPKLLEYNCRFGDPETQAVLMLIESDLYKIMLACAKGDLKQAGPIHIHENMSAATVVLASQGYPEAGYLKGCTITGTKEADSLDHVKVFHAGTKRDASTLLSSGGRVLAVSSRAATLERALAQAYAGVQLIQFKGMQFRSDIGHRARAAKREAADQDNRRIAILAAVAAFAAGALLRRAMRA